MVTPPNDLVQNERHPENCALETWHFDHFAWFSRDVQIPGFSEIVDLQTSPNLHCLAYVFPMKIAISEGLIPQLSAPAMTVFPNVAAVPRELLDAPPGAGLKLHGINGSMVINP